MNNIRDRIILINRVTKVIKGRRIMSFSVLIVSGDFNGSVGYGKGKAKEIPLAIKKAKFNAIKIMKKFNLNNNLSLFSIIKGKYSSSFIIMRPAKKGTGIIAGYIVKSILTLMGANNIVTKCNGSNNPHNVIKAVFNCLYKIQSPEEFLKKRFIYN